MMLMMNPAPFDIGSWHSSDHLGSSRQEIQFSSLRSLSPVLPFHTFTNVQRARPPISIRIRHERVDVCDAFFSSNRPVLLSQSNR
jgi:hypothetical protein